MEHSPVVVGPNRVSQSRILSPAGSAVQQKGLGTRRGPSHRSPGTADGGKKAGCGSSNTHAGELKYSVFFKVRPPCPHVWDSG